MLQYAKFVPKRNLIFKQNHALNGAVVVFFELVACVPDMRSYISVVVVVWFLMLNIGRPADYCAFSE